MKTIDMSGMGGGYENCCQLMLQAGIEFLKDKPNFPWKDYTGYKGIYGVVSTENKECKALDRAMVKGAGGDCTGAMHQCVLGHLNYISKNGRDKWLAYCSENDPKRVFDWDGTAKSCPKTDVSEKMEAGKPL